MCGIIYFKGSEANKQVKQQYHNQKARGSQGFGYVSIKNNKLNKEVRTEDDTIFKSMGKDYSGIILFHHRFPTSTPNFAECAHPIKVSNKNLKYDYYVTHNGIITNADSLRDLHIELGFKYTTELTTEWKIKESKQRYIGEIQFNDSEALAIELALYLDGYKDTIKTIGSVAFVGIQTTKEGKYIKTFYGRNAGNPLCVKNTKKGTRISSEGGENIQPNMLYEIGSNGTTAITALKIGEHWNRTEYSYGGYSNPQDRWVDDNDDYVVKVIPSPSGGNTIGLPLPPTTQTCIVPSQDDTIDDDWAGYEINDRLYMQTQVKLDKLYAIQDSNEFVDLTEKEQRDIRNDIRNLEDYLLAL